MLERFLKLSDKINQILFENVSGKCPKMISSNELKTIHEIVPMLRVFETVTEIVSREQSVTIGRLISITNYLKDNITNCVVKNAAAKRFKNTILNEIGRKLDGLEQHPIAAIACIIDPRYKKLSFSNPLNCSKGNFFHFKFNTNYEYLLTT